MNENSNLKNMMKKKNSINFEPGKKLLKLKTDSIKENTY